MTDQPRRTIRDPAIRRRRGLEASVLGLLIERDPRPLSEADLIGEMSLHGDRPGRADAVREAIGGLVEAALVERRGDCFAPSVAARRVGEMELDL